MKKVLRFLLVLILVVGVLILGLVAKNDYHLERSITIRAPKEAVFRQMAVYHNWPNWSPWYELEPTMKIDYSATDGQVGSSYHWKGSDDKTGEGTITTTSINGTAMECKLEFQKPRQSQATSLLRAEDSGNGETRATWGFDTHVPFPWNAAMVFMNFDKIMGKDFDRGLQKMKAYVESHSVDSVSIAAPAS